MALTASFTEVRRDFTAVTNKVMRDRVPVTVFKNNKPAFRIVPIEDPRPADMQPAYLEAADAIDEEYFDVFEELAK